MKILLVGTNTHGVFYHRLYVPYNALSISEGWEVLSTPSVDTITIEECRMFDVVVFNRNISDKFDPSPIYAKFRTAGTKIVMDIDDYWHISPGHPFYFYSRKTNYPKCQEDQLRFADHITCTHLLLKDEIVKLGIDRKKITIVRNAIDPDQPQFAQDFKFGNKLMWQGTPTHGLDLTLLSEIEQPITLCGYQYSDEWFDMCSKIKNPKTMGALPVNSYMNHYQDMGIALIPLKNNKFNRYKSELKLTESGWAKKPCIVSEIHPYTNLAKHMVNSIVAKTPADFKRYVNILSSNFNLQDDIRENLHEEVKKNYLIEKVNERRLEMLCNLVKN